MWARACAAFIAPVEIDGLRNHQDFERACGVIGIIGRELRFDTNLLLRADIDFCLQSLLRDRIVLVDGRYSFIHARFAGGGGNAANRSSERHEREIPYLKRKWGPYLGHVKAKGTTRLVVKVKRTALLSRCSFRSSDDFGTSRTVIL